MQSIYRQIILNSLIATCLLCLCAITFQAPNRIADAYWVFKKNQKFYRLNPQKAAKDGVNIEEQGGISFRFVLSAREYEQMRKQKDVFPLKVEWYRFNRAKLSIFDVQEIGLNQLKKFQDARQRTYYRLSSRQKSMLKGTWVVRVSNARGEAIYFNNQEEFDIIIK